jgi:ribosomal protein S18 acetylase RimI-like enzyme
MLGLLCVGFRFDPDRFVEETVTCMVVDPLAGYAAKYGLRSVTLADQACLNTYFKSLAEPLSDYTFSQLYSWQNSLHILWRELEGHLCVFANGAGDLTLLLPPIGETGSDRALAACWEIMDDFNVSHQVPDRGRIEYASEELLGRFDRARLNVQPMGMDYVYDVARMIDLAGGDLASKRQAKNRFLRNYQSRVEVYDKSKHFDGCCALLDSWKSHQDAQHAMEIKADANSVKRQKESRATRMTLEYAAELGLKGMVVYVKNMPVEGGAVAAEEWSIRGFTFGENIGRDQSSIVIEKTDLETKGLAQFIFSEFCRTQFADRPLVNAGDDWGLESLAWTKMSYRPTKLLQKYVLAKSAVAVAGYEPSIVAVVEEGAAEVAIAPAAPAVMNEAVATVIDQPAARPMPAATIRFARKDDLGAAVHLEQTCFTTYSLSKRQLQYLHNRPSNIFLVAEQEGQVIGEAIALLRHHKKGISGRIYSLAVSDSCRGQKIGRRLMSQLIEELASRGVRRAYLEVEQTNTNAVKLYEGLGFRSLGALPDYYGEGRNGWHMVYDIANEPNLFAAAVA